MRNLNRFMAVDGAAAQELLRRIPCKDRNRYLGVELGRPNSVVSSTRCFALTEEGLVNVYLGMAHRATPEQVVEGYARKVGDDLSAIPGIVGYIEQELNVLQEKAQG